MPGNSDLDTVRPAPPGRSLSRSPRPYRRTQSPQPEPEPVGIRRWSMHEARAQEVEEGIDGFDGASGPGEQNLQLSPSPLTTPSPTRSPGPVIWAFRNQTGGMGSESGTEADDELPKKLPAPPRRKAKGLREETTEEMVEDAEDGESGSWDKDVDDSRTEGRRRSGKAEGVVGEGDDDGGGGAKRRKRKIAFVRRGIEVGVMGGVVGVTLMGERRDGSPGRVWELLLENWSREILSWLYAFGGVLLAYPLSIVCRSYISARRKTTSTSPSLPTSPPCPSFSSIIHLPKSIDPAPLLYPIFFPLVVSISISSSLFFQNLILSISSLPPLLFPNFFFQWLISLFPLLVPAALSSFSSVDSSKICRSFAETLSYLPLLHKSLTDVLAYTLQPSLTLTEIRLLSTGMVNLLISSTSPQAIILKALLWVGGIGVLVGCSDLITWGVQLARIPRHRFKRAGEIVRTAGRFRKTGKEACSGFLSSSEDGGKGNRNAGGGFFAKFQRKQEKSTAATPKGKIEFKCIDGDKNKFPVSIILTPAIQSRESVSPSEHTPLMATSQPAKRKRGYSSTSPMSWYTSLTHRQARRRKYAYAAGVYAIILVLVFFAIRPYLKENAFYGIDPFPWAASYLFCGLPGYAEMTSVVSSWFGYDFVPGENWTGCSVWYNDRLAWGELPYPTDRSGAAETESLRRLYIISYWLLILAAGIATVLAVSKRFEVDTRRKIFHGMVVGMFLVVGAVDPMFTHLSMSLVLALFMIADLVRAGQLPPVSRPLSEFLQPFVDGRDLRGPVVVSHFFLLVGAAVGVWFSVAAAWAGMEGKGEVESGLEGVVRIPAATRTRELAFVAGVVCVGLGDSAASLVGRRFGRTKWGWAGGKSLEGSVAFMGAVGIGLVMARWWLKRLHAGDDAGGVGVGWGWLVWVKIWGSAVGAALMEAVVTGVNDNVVVPVGMWCVVRGLAL